MSPEIDPEETATLAVLAELGRIPGSDDTRVISGEDEVVDVLRRLDLEAIGLLAYGLDVSPAPAHLRTQLLERLAADETQDVGQAARAAITAGREPEAPPVAEVRTLPGAGGPVAWGGSGAVRRRSWAPALAAVFALLAIGAGLGAFWLASELSSAQARLARLESEVTRIEAASAAEREATQARLAAYERQRDFVTSRAALVFDLRPTAGGSQPTARGRLWVAADHQHWQLDVAGLAPAPAGREYQLWFLVDGVPTSGGTFAVEAGRGVLASAQMPAGTTGAVVTLERTGGVATPTTPRLLLAERAVDL